MGELFQPMHLLIIGGIVVLLFGGRKLPELGKGLGEGLRSCKEGMKGVTDDTTTTTTTTAATKPGDTAHIVTPKAEETTTVVK